MGTSTGERQPFPARTSRSRRAGHRNRLVAGLAVLVTCSAAVGCQDAPRSGSRSTAASTSGAASASAPAPPATTSRPATGDAQIVRTDKLDERMQDLTVRSPAVGSDVKVRLLLPRRFGSATERRWPALYLLHGCCDSYLSWTRSTDIEALSSELDALVVMPEGGRAGFYSNWRAGPRWETFHVQELPRLLERTHRASQRRVVAGVSMGGLGALGYAARHPGTFAVAASFSGVVHTRLSPDESQGFLRLLRSEGEDPYGLWGDPVTDVDTWQAHNPYDLAPRLARTRLYIYAGSGQPGPLDPPGAGPDRLEVALHAENEAFVTRVRALRLDAQTHLASTGTHSWAYWQRELRKAWPLVTDGLEDG